MRILNPTYSTCLASISPDEGVFVVCDEDMFYVLY